jgi:sugar lactone lactonase YvrE
MTMSTATPASSERFRLGEGPVWDAPRERLLWVDIEGRAVLEGVLDGGAITVTNRILFDTMVGAVAVAGDGTLLVAAQERLVVQRPDGTREDGPRVVPAGERRRLNDGKPDPAGRFLVGTLSLGGPSEREVLVRLEADGRLTVLDDDLALSNGLAWSADGRRMFSVDTVARTVSVRDYDPGSGAVGPRRVHLRLEDGFPDGIAMDAAGHLWVAVWGGGEVRRYAPDGSLVDQVATGAPHTSSVAFAGDDLRTLVITTATSELSDDQVAAHPDSGRLFCARADVPGLPVAPWRGTAGPAARPAGPAAPPPT